MTAPTTVLELVERFRSDLPTYKSVLYKETEVRQEFIDPLFEALGWDIGNRRGAAATYREVVLEYSMKIGDTTRAPDYLFRVDGSNRFFVEAKKPSVNLRDGVSPAYQVRRYAWTEQHPLSILTDFEEFAIYDCRVKPDKADKANVARYRIYSYEEYADKWDEIAEVFSREAVLAGSLEKFAQEQKAPKGALPVDKAFLAEIDGWRALLAKDIAIWNPVLTQRELNYAVQMTLDRLIFLRIGEDRGIELYGKLQGLLKGGEVYKRLIDQFRDADDRYNSGLFHFKEERGREEPDNLTLNIYIGDEPLKKIIRNLYYPDSPYEFSVLPIEVLGNVYEQFLGKVIVIGAERKVEVEEKPEVRKAGGVYYTLSYIVEYIVKNTVGKLLEGKTLKEAAKLRIVDPACGSGSFLIGAYQHLLNWYLAQYEADEPAKRRKELYRGAGGDWRLTTGERKRILLNNIYGVDIDTQAVEVTKLSLSLKMLEGETEQTLGTTRQMFQERALPDLSNNIKCGNSLVGQDFYDFVQPGQIADEELYRINPFDWKGKDGFREIMRSGGFDAVIGNPPYTYIIPPIQQQYFSQSHQYQDYQKDLYLLFLEQYSRLIKLRGLLGVIVSNTWLLSVTYRKIREHLATSYHWLQILNLPKRVFQAAVDTMVFIFERAEATADGAGTLIVDIRRGNEIHQSHKLSWSDIPRNGDVINIVSPARHQKLFLKVRDISSPLSEIYDVYNGTKPFEKGKGKPPQSDQIMQDKPYVKEGPAPDTNWKPLLRGSLIHRYITRWDNSYWILYGPWLAAPRDPAIFEAPLKIVIRQTGYDLVATLAQGGFIARDNLHILLPRNLNYALHYALGLINSRLMDFTYAFMNPEKGEGLAQVKKQHVEQFPIRPINFSDPADKKHHDDMVVLVERMLDLHKRLPAAKTAQERTVLQRQIEATDKQIDNLVYDLYGLTPEEREIVEGATK